MRFQIPSLPQIAAKTSFRAAALLLVLGAAFYLRMYPAWVFPKDLAAKKADVIAAARMKGFFKEQIQSSRPDWSKAALDLAVASHIRQALTLRRGAIRGTLDAARREAENLPSTRAITRYLLESDPYYYLNLTQKILSHGLGSLRFSGRLYFNPLMNAPEGFWYPFDAHPVVGALWARFLRVWNPALPLEDAVRWIPILLTFAVGGVFWVLATRIFRAGYWPAVGGLWVLLASPIYLKRSLLGWYDTDPYNLLFVLILFGCLVQVVSAAPNRRWLWAAGAGLSGGLFSLFWRGWFFPFLALTVLTILIPQAGAFLAGRASLPNRIRPCLNALLFAFAIILAALLFVGGVWKPAGLLQEGAEFRIFVKGFFAPGIPLRPDVMVTVGELKSADFHKLSGLLGGILLIPLSLTGWVAAFFLNRRTSAAARPRRIFAGGFLLLITSLLLAAKMERFVLFAVPFVSLGITLLFCRLPGLFRRSLRFLLIPEAHPKVESVPAWLTAALALTISFQLTANADQGIRKFYPIFNPAWESALLRLKSHTPPESIIATWWPPGHFITAVANRRVLWDGATQDEPKSYWVAALLLEENEAKASAILRMLTVSGTRAEDFLKARGWSSAQSIPWILTALGQTREAVSQDASARFGSQNAEELLNLLFPKTAPPVYVLLYSELIEQALGVEFIGGWNFERAEALAKWNVSNPGKIRPDLLRRGRKEYVQLLWLLAQKPSPALEQGQIIAQSGKILKYSNGVRLNTQTGETWIESKAYGSGIPVSTYRVREGSLVETPFKNRSLEASVYFLPSEYSAAKSSKNPFDAYARSVLLSDRLAKSLMMKLYFFNAAGMRAFEPFGAAEIAMPPTRIRLYRWAPKEK